MKSNTNDKLSNKKKIIQIWLTSVEGEVLVKNIPTNYKNLKISNLTIEAESIEAGIKEIEKKWGILCTEGDLKEVYSFESEVNRDIQKIGYVLKANLNDQHKSLILSKFSGHFIDYNEINDQVSLFRSSIDFKEAFYSLLAWMDKIFGYTPLYHCTVNKQFSNF